MLYQLFGVLLALCCNCLTAVKYGDFTNVRILKKFISKFLKLLLRVKKSKSSMTAYGETGRYLLYINRYVRMMQFLGNVLKTDNVIMKTNNDMLEGMKKGEKLGKSNKNIIDMYGFSYVWNNQKNFDLKKSVI